MTPVVEADGRERRLLTDDEAPAFNGVGRLNIAGRRFCTATLISESRAITAAHCLYHPRTHEPVPLSEFRFVAGQRRDEHAALREVARVAVPSDFTYDGTASFESMRRDIALIELAAPVDDAEAEPFAVSAAPEGDVPIVIVSYARDRAHAASIQDNCRVIALFGTVVALDCGVNFGASGAPVFMLEKGAMRLFGAVSATGRIVADGAEVTLAILAEPEISELEAGLSDVVPDAGGPEK